MKEVSVSKSNEDMDVQFMKEAGEIKSAADLERFAEDWGMTVEEVLADPLFGDLPESARPAEENTIQGRGLLGDRDKDGNLKSAADTKKEGEVMFTHANGSTAYAEPGTDLADELRAMQYFPGAIAGQNAGKKFQPDKVMKKKVNLNEADFSDIGVEEPEGEDMPEDIMGNQYGYYKKKGQNFWTVNNDDPYWETHEMGTGDAWSDADLKKETKELDIDFSSWFK